jgi:hypothetical protein
MSSDGGRGGPGQDRRVIDLRPMVWDAEMVAPASGAGATVVLRVTYRTLEEICDAVLAVDDSADRAPERIH